MFGLGKKSAKAEHKSVSSHAGATHVDQKSLKEKATEAQNRFHNFSENRLPPQPQMQNKTIVENKVKPKQSVEEQKVVTVKNVEKPIPVAQVAPTQTTPISSSQEFSNLGNGNFNDDQNSGDDQLDSRFDLPDFDLSDNMLFLIVVMMVSVLIYVFMIIL